MISQQEAEQMIRAAHPHLLSKERADMIKILRENPHKYLPVFDGLKPIEVVGTVRTLLADTQAAAAEAGKAEV